MSESESRIGPDVKQTGHSISRHLAVFHQNSLECHPPQNYITRYKTCHGNYVAKITKSQTWLQTNDHDIILLETFIEK